tara:strand:+ start:64 stop:693 length:630 start_codon:yes stop_codon:yes gene_type:complete
MDAPNKSVTLDLKTIIIIALLLFGAYHFLLNPTAEKTTIKETQTIDIEHIIETAINTALANQKPETQTVIIRENGTVQSVKDISEVPPEDIDKVAQLNKYKDTTSIDNAKFKGKIFSEILSDGTVYSNKITTDFEAKTITNTIETETVIYGSGLFISPGINYNTLNGIESVEASLNYINKMDFGVGVGAQYNLQSNTMSYGIKVHKKLF